MDTKNVLLNKEPIESSIIMTRPTAKPETAAILDFSVKEERNMPMAIKTRSQAVIQITYDNGPLRGDKARDYQTENKGKNRKADGIYNQRRKIFSQHNGQQLYRRGKQRLVSFLLFSLTPQAHGQYRHKKKLQWQTYC